MRCIFVFFIFICSCSVRNSNVQLVESGDVSFPIDYSSSIRPRHVSIYQLDGKECMVLVNREGSPSLQFFDLDTQKEIHRIQLHREGPNRVGRPLVAHVQSKDSIFIVSGYDNFISLIDWDGVVKRRYFPSEHHIDQGKLWLWESEPLILSDQKIYLGISGTACGRYSIFDDFMSVCLDLNSGKFSYFKKYNTVLRGRIFGFIDGIYYQNIGDNGIIINSYASSNVIDFIDVVGDKFYSKEIDNSIYFSGLNPVNEGVDIDYKDCLDKFKYGSIIYDKYRDVYYRFVEHPFTKKEISEDFYSTYFSHRFSVMVFDNDFNKIGETMFADNRFYCKTYFIGSDGLYISNSHPKNPFLKEDFITFTRFVPEF